MSRHLQAYVHSCSMKSMVLFLCLVTFSAAQFSKTGFGSRSRDLFSRFADDSDEDVGRGRRDSFEDFFDDRSLEDLLDDLHDDDPRDRAKARAALEAQGGGVTFRTHFGNSDRGIPSTRTSHSFGSSSTRRNANSGLSSFDSIFGKHALAFNRNQGSSVPATSSSGFNSGFGGASGRPFEEIRTSEPLNRFVTSSFGGSPRQKSGSFSKKSRSSNDAFVNAIRRNGPFSASKDSFFRNAGFNWPGGNGYYVRMSQGNSKPVTYFVKYDD